MVGHLNPTGEEAFDAFVNALERPVYLVTTVSRKGERSGCLVGFATQCSIEPRMFLVGLSHLNHTWRVAETAEVLAVHTVPPGEHELAALFAEQTGDEIDKFARCRWSPGYRGVPILEACPSWFTGRIVDRLVGLGDHAGYVLVPVEVSSTPPDPGSLTLAAATGFEPGHPA